MSDRSQICLDNGNSHMFQSSQFKFKAYWLNHEEFSDIMIKWWFSFPTGPLTTQVSKLNLSKLKQKLKGWNANIRKEIRDKKNNIFFFYYQLWGSFET
jgi:hypothetical protein